MQCNATQGSQFTVDRPPSDVILRDPDLPRTGGRLPKRRNTSR
jgi:hypothetical protein